VLYDLDDRVIRRVTFRYDERRLLLEEGEVVGGSIRDDFRNVFRYDALGRKIEVLQRWGDELGGARLAFAYNGHGDVVQKSIEQNLGFLRDDDAGSQSWMERFAYQYDDHGNWIQRTTETISHSGEARVSMAVLVDQSQELKRWAGRPLLASLPFAHQVGRHFEVIREHGLAHVPPLGAVSAAGASSAHTRL